MEILEESQVNAITPIYAGSPTMKQWLTHNGQGLVVNKYPCFLVAREGMRTKVYSPSEVNTIIGMIRELES